MRCAFQFWRAYPAANVRQLVDQRDPKREDVKKAIEAVGARLLCLPPYSPDLNPIEQAFAKLKALLQLSP